MLVNTSGCFWSSRERRSVSGGVDWNSHTAGLLPLLYPIYDLFRAISREFVDAMDKFGPEFIIRAHRVASAQCDGNHCRNGLGSTPPLHKHSCETNTPLCTSGCHIFLVMILGLHCLPLFHRDVRSSEGQARRSRGRLWSLLLNIANGVVICGERRCRLLWQRGIRRNPGSHCGHRRHWSCRCHGSHWSHRCHHGLRNSTLHAAHSRQT